MNSALELESGGSYLVLTFLLSHLLPRISLAPNPKLHCVSLDVGSYFGAPLTGAVGCNYLQGYRTNQVFAAAGMYYKVRAMSESASCNLQYPHHERAYGS